MYIIMLYRPEADENPGQRHGEHPFEGIEIVQVSLVDPDIDRLVDRWVKKDGHKLHIEQV